MRPSSYKQKSYSDYKPPNISPSKNERLFTPTPSPLLIMYSYGLLGFGGKAQVYGQRYIEYGSLTVYSVCQTGYAGMISACELD